MAFALAAAVMFFVAIGYEGWDCGANILSKACQNGGDYRLTGYLLLAAGPVVLLAGIFLAACSCSWGATVACVLAVISAALSIAGMVLFGVARLQLSHFIATAAMTLMTALSGALIFDLASKY